MSGSDDRVRSGLWGVAVLVLVDLAIVWLSTFAAYWLRFEGSVPEGFLRGAWMAALLGSVIYVAGLFAFGLYRRVWRHAGMETALAMAGAVAAGAGVMLVIDFVLAGSMRGLRPIPVGIVLIQAMLVFLGASAVRTYGRLAALVAARATGEAQRAVIIGAGDAGSLLLQDILRRSDIDVRVVGFLDDDAAKHRRLVRGVRVLGPVAQLSDLVDRGDVDVAFVAVPSASPEQRREILGVCAGAGVKTRMMPSLEGLSATPGLGDLRKVRAEDLLWREQVDIEAAEVVSTIRGRVVLVTGAAGSIGSELCRQIAGLKPEKLVLLDVDETRLFELEIELAQLGSTAHETALCDIRDTAKLCAVFERTCPALVLHAAAYKHVPMMEAEPDEAVKANVAGTANVIEACRHAGAARLVLISTDKAVSPSSVMGLTKAIAERLAIDACSRGLAAVAVRFGNVLGSRGSVVPLFEAQLRDGGPLQVTHPDITRYFMTIPEAASLVLQAQALSQGGELFVLEMGDPVRIVDLARKLIVLSGTEAEIVFTGLRPGEKLHEALTTDAEELVPTTRAKILRVNALPYDPGGVLMRDIETLVEAARGADREGVNAALAKLFERFEGER